jgi:hypothetical protein
MSTTDEAVQEPVIQRVMSRLADLLDEDQFKEIEGMVVSAGCTPPEQAAIEDQAINAIKQALAAPVQDPTDAWFDKCFRSDPPAPAPAPVPSALPDFSPIFGGITKGEA